MARKAEAEVATAPFVVIAKADKWRGGRHWTRGSHVFDTPEKLAELGDAEQIAKLQAALREDALSFEVQGGEVAA